MNSASAKPTVKQGIERMNIEPAEGGVVSEIRMKRPPSKGLHYMPSPDPVRTIHPTVEDLHAHVTKHFGHLFKKAGK